MMAPYMPLLKIMQMPGSPEAMHHGWGGFSGPGFMWFGPLVWLVLLILLIWGISTLVRRSRPTRNGTDRPSEKSPLDILNDRYARGEIDTREYEERRRALTK